MTNWKKTAKRRQLLLNAVVRQSATMRRLLIEYVEHDEALTDWDEYKVWHRDWVARVHAELLHWVTGEVDERNQATVDHCTG